MYSNAVSYGDAVFLYFLGRLPDAQFDRIISCKELGRWVKVLKKDVNLDFLTKEAMAFHFDMGGERSAYPSVYSDLYLGLLLTSTASPLQERLVSCYLLEGLLTSVVGVKGVP